MGFLDNSGSPPMPPFGHLFGPDGDHVEIMCGYKASKFVTPEHKAGKKQPGGAFSQSND